ncbi:response regulator [Piscinibacter sp. HJYY11]|uniref:response regulator n=1 Tax=Piscinibacter sp. HJYY11 TaxID=2801333 RepID=UPI00191DA3F9|nr:response regulator [Piscinibacter sp. HJYY11]MBL0728619.1 response regulator [Piscinibacter sp. HJYY11]
MKLVLLAEDEYGNAEVLRLLLEAEGFRVAPASNGKLALELLGGEKPAVILTDFMMPHVTGGELGQAVRANPLLEDIPIIVMSGTHEAVVRESFTDYDAFVEKPYAADSLLQLVGHFAVHGRANQAGGNPELAAPKLDASLQRFLRGLKV